MNRDEGLQALKDSIKAIEDVITNKNGTFVIQQAVSFCQYCIGQLNHSGPPAHCCTTVFLCYRTNINVLHNVSCLFLQPRVVTDLDEADLAKELEALEKQNAEVDGDDDNPDDEDEHEEP